MSSYREIDADSPQSRGDEHLLRRTLRGATDGATDVEGLLRAATSRGRRRLRHRRTALWGGGTLTVAGLTLAVLAGAGVVGPSPLHITPATTQGTEDPPEPSGTGFFEQPQWSVDTEQSTIEAAAKNIDTIVAGHLPGWPAGQVIITGYIDSQKEASIPTGWTWKATDPTLSPGVVLTVEVTHLKEPTELSASLCSIKDMVTCSLQTLPDGRVLMSGTSRAQLGDLNNPATPVQPFATVAQPDGRLVSVTAGITDSPDLPADAEYPVGSSATADAVVELASDSAFDTLPLPQDSTD